MGFLEQDDAVAPQQAVINRIDIQLDHVTMSFTRFYLYYIMRGETSLMSERTAYYHENKHAERCDQSKFDADAPRKAFEEIRLS